MILNIILDINNINIRSVCVEEKQTLETVT